jgi:hypothetical protein
MKTLYRMDEVAPPLTAALLRLHALQWPERHHIILEDVASGAFVQFCNVERGVLLDLPIMQLITCGLEPGEVAQTLSLERGRYGVLQKLVEPGQDGSERAAAEAILLFDRIFGTLGVAEEHRPRMVLMLTEEISAPRKEMEQQSHG